MATQVGIDTTKDHRLAGEMLRAVRERGRAVLLHGGGQTRHSWKQTADVLVAQGWTVMLYDARGHGESDWRRDGDYSLAGFAGDLAAMLAAFGGPPPALVGASLGGMTALLYAARADARLAGLVLVDIAPRMDEREVSRIHTFMAGTSRGFASLDEAHDAVGAYNPHRPRPSSTDGLRRNLRKGDDGRWHWLWDPALLTNASEATHDALPHHLLAAAARVRVPALVVRGLQSRMVSDAAIAELVGVMPEVASIDIAGAGHMVAGDDNDRFTEAVLSFLATLAPG